MLKSAGVDVDIPGSTRLLHQKPFSTTPEAILPGVYRAVFVSRSPQSAFPMARAFDEEIVKMPVCGLSCQQVTADLYVHILETVAARFNSHTLHRMED